MQQSQNFFIGAAAQSSALLRLVLRGAEAVAGAAAANKPSWYWASMMHDILIPKGKNRAGNLHVEPVSFFSLLHPHF